MRYAKGAPEDVCIVLTVHNRGPDEASLHVLPQLWLRNTWSWGRSTEGYWPRGVIQARGERRFVANCADLPAMTLDLDDFDGEFRGLLATENDTNPVRLFGGEQGGPCKDAFHEHVVFGRTDVLAREPRGSKVAYHCVLRVPAGEARELRLRLRRADLRDEPFGSGYDDVLAARRADADAFYRQVLDGTDDEQRRIQRQAYAGLVWSKQFYWYDVSTWLEGDPAQPTAAEAAPQRPQRRLLAPLQPRRRVDARQVGVPVVRGLGPGLPHDPVRAHRPAVRQGPAAAVPARVVHGTPTGRSRPTSSRSTTSTRRFTRGPAGASTR